MSEEVKPVASVDDDGMIKLDFSKDAVQEQSTDEVSVRDESEASAEVPVENVETTVEEPAGESGVEVAEPVQENEPVETPVLQEITEEQVEEAVDELQEEMGEAIAEAAETGMELPENIQKVIDFMNDTGGTLEDYVRLNTDYSTLNEDQLLREYYQNTNPNLDNEDINFLLEDQFSFEEDIDDERDIRRKKLARKQALAEAKNHLEGLKSKYYNEIKMGSRLTSEQQKAVEFFNRYNKESEETAKIAEQQKARFKSESAKVFNDKFEGFDFNVGEKNTALTLKTRLRLVKLRVTLTTLSRSS